MAALLMEQMGLMEQMAALLMEQMGPKEQMVALLMEQMGPMEQMAALPMEQMDPMEQMVVCPVVDQLGGQAQTQQAEGLELLALLDGHPKVARQMVV